MRYDPKLGAKSGGDPSANITILGKKKRCVYCGHTFSVHPDQTRSCVVTPGVLPTHNAHFFAP